MIIAACRYATAIVTFHRWVMWGLCWGRCCVAFIFGKSVEYIAADGKPADDICVISKTQRKITGIHLVWQPVLAAEQCDCWLASCRNHGTGIFRQYSGRLVASQRGQTLRMRIDRRPARFAKPTSVRLQRSATSTASVVAAETANRNLHTAHRRLLHHLITGAAGD